VTRWRIFVFRWLLTVGSFVSGPVLTAAEIVPDAAAAYWIFFDDKAIADDSQFQQALAAVIADYSPAAISRRQKRSSLAQPFGYDDLPVATAYSSAVEQTGATVRVTSNWLNAVSIQAAADQLDVISSLPFVRSIQPVARYSAPQTINVTAENFAPLAPAETATFYGNAETQLAQIGIQQVHALGYTGAGVTIGVLDTGFRRTHVAFNEPGHPIDVIAEYDFINNDANTADTINNQHVHGTYILGVMGAYKPNVLVGAAYGASFLLAKTEVVPTETPIEEDYWVDGLEWLEMNGADVVTSSLGYRTFDSPYNTFPPSYAQTDLNGFTAVTTQAANLATQAGLPIVNAVGNNGNDLNPATATLIAPSDAELVISVGAVNSSGTLASFSSTGRNTLPWIKPEVLAQGVSTQTVSPTNNTAYLGVNGTSLSTPLVASTVALMLQANPNLTVAQIRDILFSTASRADNPDTQYYREGYGIINAYEAVLAAQAMAVPEPGTMGIAVVGLVCLVVFAWIRPGVSESDYYRRFSSR